MSTVTAIILARNEEKHIVDCIKSIQFADEILVIDDGSTDQTVPLATNLGAKVITTSYEWRLVTTTEIWYISSTL